MTHKNKPMSRMLNNKRYAIKLFIIVPLSFNSLLFISSLVLNDSLELLSKGSQVVEAFEYITKTFKYFNELCSCFLPSPFGKAEVRDLMYVEFGINGYTSGVLMLNSFF